MNKRPREFLAYSGRLCRPNLSVSAAAENCDVHISNTLRVRLFKEMARPVPAFFDLAPSDAFGVIRKGLRTGDLCN